MMTQRATLFALLAIATAGTSDGASAETMVKITLWDKGDAAMDHVGQHPPIGMAVDGADPGLATMGVTLDPQEVPAGEISFRITNDSGAFYHAVLVSAVADQTVPLPYLTEEERVDEAAAGITANLGELRPHDAKTKAAALTPGTYILYCNIAGHYAMGMWALLTVTE
ncbi:sulfocyanin-like copper-binding protein [Tabrizicola sp.]|uniref:sulfocyanin-like copper-binding protein n=1 Tax=Tabrizicola sp. TaxID=2005166 RepID=UPI0025E88243|nr:sulfocyanin-like copper-binding protein [Tabrizicola sp.]